MTERFICPVCHSRLSLNENKSSLICEKEIKPHCFDIASAGYVNLDRSHSGGGDSKECVRSRSAFLGTGHYKPISDNICALSEKFANKSGLIIDAGCGEGYYTSALAKALPDADTVGLDISKSAVEHGAKFAKRADIKNLSYAVSSVFELPFADMAADAVVSIFAPCPEKEFSRVLKKDGILIIAAAGEEHLLGLKKAIYDEVYLNEERADLPSSCFELMEKNELKYKIKLKSSEEILNLFAMTPYFYRTSIQDKEKLSLIQELETEIHIEFSVYKRNG